MNVPCRSTTTGYPTVDMNQIHTTDILKMILSTQVIIEANSQILNHTGRGPETSFRRITSEGMRVILICSPSASLGILGSRRVLLYFLIIFKQPNLTAPKFIPHDTHILDNILSTITQPRCVQHTHIIHLANIVCVQVTPRRILCSLCAIHPEPHCPRPHRRLQCN